MDLVQNTICPLYKGEVIRVTISHTYLGNFSRWWVQFGQENPMFGATNINAGTEVVDWVVDADYPAGTPILLTGTIWPGSATFWWQSIHVVSSSRPTPSSTSTTVYSDADSATGTYADTNVDKYEDAHGKSIP